MEPVFYDVNTFEPLPPSGVVARELQPAQARQASPARPTAATLVPSTPLRAAITRPLEPAGRFERLVVTRERIVALGAENLRVLRRDLTGLHDFPAPIGMRVDAPRDLLYMADVLGSVVARRTSDLSIALRLIPTFARGYERWVLYADDSSLLLASVELRQMAEITHLPDVTMFEWWRLGDLGKVDPGNFVPEGAEVGAVTYSRTRPLLFAAPAQAGEPLVLAQPAHLLWLDRTLERSADVAIPPESAPLALAVDARGRALVAVRGAGGDRFWIIDRTGQQLCDIALSEQPLARAPAILPAAGGVVYVIAGTNLLRIDESGERWRKEFPSGLVAAELDGDAGLLAASGNRVLRIDAQGNAAVLYTAAEALVSSPAVLDGQILVTTSREAFALVPPK